MRDVLRTTSNLGQKYRVWSDSNWRISFMFKRMKDENLSHSKLELILKDFLFVRDGIFSYYFKTKYFKIPVNQSNASWTHHRPVMRAFMKTVRNQSG